VAHHGSGEIFLAFATGSGGGPSPGGDPGGGSGPGSIPARGEATAPRPVVPDRALDPIFACTVEATEEAVLNALWFAHDVRGRDDRLVRALPHDDVLELLAAHGRLDRRAR
jgi:L-aminopeptidase/D-esterase-like protein